MARKNIPILVGGFADYDYSKPRDGVNNGVLGNPDVKDTFEDNTKMDFPGMLGKGENHEGFKSVVPDTAFGSNEITGEGRKKWNNLFRWS